MAPGPVHSLMSPRLLALSLLLSAASLSAQPRAPVGVGDTVKLKAPGLSGRFHVTGLGADSLTLVRSSDDTTRVIHIGAIDKLSVLRGRHSRVVSGLGGLGAGLAFGGLFGYAVGYGDGDRETGVPWNGTPGEVGEVGALLFGGIGSFVGLMRGLGNPFQKWEKVPVATIRGGVSPAGGVSLGLTIRF
jgi:hypothetical protein